MLDNIRSVQLYLHYEERASLCTCLLRWHFELILLLMDFHTFSFSVADSIGKRLNTSTFNAWSFVSCCSALPRYRRKAKVSERTGASLFPFPRRLAPLSICWASPTIVWRLHRLYRPRGLLTELPVSERIWIPQQNWVKTSSSTFS